MTWSPVKIKQLVRVQKTGRPQPTVEAPVGKRARIAFVVANMHWGGTFGFMQNLGNSLGTDYEKQYVGWHGKFIDSAVAAYKERTPDSKVYYAGPHGGDLVKAMLAFRPDIVVYTGPANVPGLLKPHLKTTYLYVAHTTCSWSDVGISYGAGLLHTVIGVGRGVCDHYRETHHQSNCVSILGAATQFALPRIAPTTVLRFGYFGNFEPRKKAAELLTCYQGFCKPGDSFTLAGGEAPYAQTYLAKVQKAAAAITDTDVRIVLNVRDRQALLSELDVLLVYSDWEGWPQTMIEAMACGVPVVARRICGPSVFHLEIPDDAITYVDHYNELPAAVEKLRDPEVRRAQALAAFRFAKEKHTLRATKLRFEPLVQRICAGTAGELQFPTPTKKIMSLIRPGELGDIIMTATALQEFRRRGHPVHYHARPEYQDLVSLLGAEYRPHTEEPVGEVVDFRGVIEGTNDLGHCAADLFLDQAGLVNVPRVAKVPFTWKGPGTGSLAVNLFSARKFRSLTEDGCTAVLQGLVDAGIKVTAVGARAPKVLPKGVTYRRHSSFGEFWRGLSEFDYFLSIDTGTLHAAGVSGIPTIGLFNAHLNSKLAVHYPHVLGLNMMFPCSPCYSSIGDCALPVGSDDRYACSSPDPAAIVDAVLSTFYGKLPFSINFGKWPGRQTTAVILSYNTKPFLKRCLETHLPVLVPDVRIREVVVIDNGSVDGSRELLRKFANVPKVRVVLNDTNVGIHAAWNAVVTSCSDDILLIGSDTEVVNYNWFTALRYFLDRHPKAGLVAGQQIRPESDGRQRIIYGGQASLGKGHPHRVGWVDQHDWAVPTKHDFVTHSQVLIRREVFDRIGLYDLKYKVYCGDSDFGRRATRAGFECWYDPASVILHWEGRSVGAAKVRREVTNADFDRDLKLFLEDA